jgi:hypothetical protein
MSHLPRRAFLSTALALCVAGCAGDDPVSPTVPHAASIELVSGSGQIAVYGSTLPIPLLVHVKDQFGTSFLGGVVTFTTTGTVMLDRYSITTGASGTAQVIFSYGAHAGIDTVTAMVAGVSTAVSFFETGNPGIAASLTIVSGNNQSKGAGTPLANDLVVQVSDVAGNPTPLANMVWVASNGTPAFTQNRTGLDGQAHLQFTPAAGANAITVSVDHTSLSTAFTATGN